MITCALCGLEIKERHAYMREDSNFHPVHFLCYNEKKILELEDEIEELKKANKELMNKFYS